MLKIGVTGGIGSGKTTVCKIFEVLDIPVYYADPRAKLLMIEDYKLVKEIKKLLGDKSYNKDKSLNRKYIANIIFNDKNKLNALNALVHPAVKDDFDKWCDSQNSPYVLKEAALLFENGSYKSLDKTILVSAPLELRVLRVMKRDNHTRESILSRVRNQMPESEKEKLADIIIKNDNDISLISQIIEIHRQLVKDSNAKIH